jgi:hypothetical protein
LKTQVKSVAKYAQIALFILVLGVLVFQLYRVDWKSFTNLKLTSPIFLMLSFLLIPLNQYFEWLKWKQITSTFAVDNLQVQKAFFAGIGTAFLSPNGWGNFIGRLFYLPKKEWIFVVLATAFGNLSQLIATFLFGCCIVFIEKTTFPVLVSTLILFVLSLIIYSSSLKLTTAFFSKSKWTRRIQHYEFQLAQIRWKVLVFSILRYICFALQFVFLFQAFGESDFFFLLVKIIQVYLFTALVPALWSGKILIRETVALSVFSGTLVNDGVVLIACTLIWIFNIIIPTLFSSFVALRMKRKEI